MTKALTVTALACLFGGAQALTLDLVGPSRPSGSSTLFTAVGTANTGNNKARLEPRGFARIEGGNPGNGWFYGTTPRSWELSWNNTTKSVSFKLFSSSDWTGPEATNGLMNATPTLDPGNTLVGLSIGYRLSAANQSLNLDNIQFNSGSGWQNIDAAEGTFSGNVFSEQYFALNGTLTDWTLRGTANFPTGTTTGDSMRFFVAGVQAVPEPGTMAALGLGAAAMLRRRKAARRAN